MELGLQDRAMPQHYSGNPPSESSTHLPALERGTQLSVIVEGDESPERSHVNILPLSTIASDPGGLLDAVPQLLCEAEEYPTNSRTISIDHKSQTDPSPDERHPVSSPINSHHSIQLNSPHEVLSSRAGTGNYTEPLPSQVAIDSPRNCERNAFTAPLPVVPVSNPFPMPRTISVPLNDSSPKVLAHKNGTAGFPMLPAPSPLRKSMRVTQEALAGAAIPTSVPALVPLGKRTSWLMKAREAKAMEGTNSLPGTSATVTSGTLTRVPTAIKRKSGEMLGALPAGSDCDKEQRKPKVAKSTEGSLTPLISMETGKTSQHDFPSVPSEPAALPCVLTTVPVDGLESHAMDVDEQITHLDFAEEGFIDLFKRTVEGLGARAGKSMGKSLGGAAAVAALVEARAAAEAKVAERNKVNSDSSDSEVLPNSGPPDQEPPETRLHPDNRFSYAPAPQTEGDKRELSLSDLVPGTVQKNEPGLSMKTEQALDVGVRVNSCDESVSTTPPDSPPMRGNLRFVKPTGPVFNKPPPPPVFMPPVSKQPSIALGNPNFPSSQFTLPVPTDIPARPLPSDGLPPSYGTSQASVQAQQSTTSETILENGDGVPMRVPSMQNTFDSEPRTAPYVPAIDDDDDDDSWPLEEKLAAAESGWRPFDFSNVDKEDTWSSLPTESQGPTRSLTAEKNDDAVTSFKDMTSEVETNRKVGREQETIEVSDAERSISEASELEEVAKIGMTSSRRGEVCDFECFPIAFITNDRTANRSKHKPSFNSFHRLFIPVSGWLLQSSHQTC